jgi:hypothetical protein
MSTEYRKADCQSTKNVMGDKPVDPQSGPSGTSLGFKTDENFAYLGHFKQEKFLRMGHNEVMSTVMPYAPNFGRRPRQAATLAGTALDTAGRGLASRAIRSGDMAAAAERPVLAARLAARAAGVGGAERRALVSAARLDPNSRMMERRARRMA